jgi:hypothetical protein
MLPPEIDDDTMGLIISWMYNEVPRIELTMDGQEKNWNFFHNLRLAVKVLGIKDLLTFLNEHLLTFEESHLAVIVEKKVQNSGNYLEVKNRERSDRITEDVNESCDDKIHTEWTASVTTLNHSLTIASPEVNLKQDPDVPCASEDEYVSPFSSSREISLKKTSKVKTDSPPSGKNTDLSWSTDNSKKKRKRKNLNLSGHKRGNRAQQIECEICSNLFKDKWHMKRHLEQYHVNDQQRQSKLATIQFCHLASGMKYFNAPTALFH